MQLRKGILKEEVNVLLAKNNWDIRLDDNIYNGNNVNHRWRCRCGGLIEARSFSKIRERNSVLCNECKYKIKELEYKQMVEANTDYEYIKSYRSGEITEGGIMVKDSPYIQIKHLACGRIYETTAASFKQGRMRCTCSPYERSVEYKYPEISNMIYLNEKREKVENEKKKFIYAYSNQKFYYKCNRCSVVSNKPKKLAIVTLNGYSCEFCSDGISIPEKFFMLLLKSLNIDYNYNTSFEWSESKRYDFFLKAYNYLVEINGIQHYEQSARGRSLEEEEENDKYKANLANGKCSKYIVIDCRESRLEWIKLNCIRELGDIFDLTKVNWDYLWKKAQKSFVIEAWELKKKGSTIPQIANELSLTTTTIRKYLKSGEIIDEVSEINERKRKVICLNSKKIFNSLMESGASIGVTQKEMYRCCNSKNKQLGKDEEGNVLKWMYYDEYIQSTNEKIRRIENSKHYSSRAVICITTGEVFENSVKAGEEYNICSRNIRACCYGKRNYCGKLSDGTELRWKFLI